jgi:hypothetical protein
MAQRLFLLALDGRLPSDPPAGAALSTVFRLGTVAVGCLALKAISPFFSSPLNYSTFLILAERVIYPRKGYARNRLRKTSEAVLDIPEDIVASQSNRRMEHQTPEA